jgi:hypothetical protein
MLKSTLAIAALMLCASAWADEAPAKKAPAAKADGETTCMVTGSRIPRKGRDCALTFGRTYSQQDLQRTGRFNNAEALKALDPAL